MQRAFDPEVKSLNVRVPLIKREQYRPIRSFEDQKKSKPSLEEAWNQLFVKTIDILVNTPDEKPLLKIKGGTTSYVTGRRWNGKMERVNEIDRWESERRCELTPENVVRRELPWMTNTEWEERGGDSVAHHTRLMYENQDTWLVKPIFMKYYDDNNILEPMNIVQPTC